MTIPALLLCVGAQKSGTTWLYNRLAEHDETRSATQKEIHYFSTVHCGVDLGPRMKMNAMRRMIENHPQQVIKFIQTQATGEKPPHAVQRAFRPMNDNWYIDFFQGPGRYAMDFTPEYALLPDAGHDHIKRVSDRQKVIFIMREPLDRALSAVRYFFKTQRRDITTATEAEILEVARKPVITGRSRYDRTVDTLVRNYAAEDLLFLFYETMMADKAGTLDAVCDWLSIARLDLSPEELEQRDNPTDPFALPASVVDELRGKLAPVRAAIEEKFPQAHGAWAKHTWAEHKSLRAEKFFSSVEVVPEKLKSLRCKPKARKQLVIYFTPRSGSSWLTEVLSQSNRLGRANEVFNPGFIPNIAQACNATSFADYIDLIQRRLNTRGVFSFEITWHQLKAVFDDADAFMHDFGAAKPAWLIRHDIVAQAVSLAKMVTTKVAHSISANAEQRQQSDFSFTYDPALIRRWLVHILAAERGTEAHFTEYGLKPLRLTYEDMMAAGAERMRAQFAQYIDIPDMPELAIAPRHSKLASSQNAAYAARFRHDEAAFLRDVEEERAAWLAASHAHLAT